MYEHLRPAEALRSQGRRGGTWRNLVLSQLSWEQVGCVVFSRFSRLLQLCCSLGSKCEASAAPPYDWVVTGVIKMMGKCSIWREVTNKANSWAPLPPEDSVFELVSTLKDHWKMLVLSLCCLRV